MVANPNIDKKKKDAREMLNMIAQTQLQSGYPYLMFKDNANKVHANSNIGQIKMSNLCTEIFQLQETSVINDYGIEDEIKRDISCNLGSLNIVNVMESGKFRDSVFTGMDALTVVSDEANIQNAPGVKKANSELHSVGLGVMNLHGYLAKNKIGYESEEAKDFANIFFMIMNYYSSNVQWKLQKSVEKSIKTLSNQTMQMVNILNSIHLKNLNQNLKRFANFLMVSIYLLQMIGKNCKIK